METELVKDFPLRNATDAYVDDKEDYDDEEAEDASEFAEDGNEEEYEIGDEAEPPVVQSQLEAWRDVHTHLVHAVGIAREAVASKKLQRRFWLEEICSNLTEKGRLVTSSVWNRPTAPKRTAKRAAKASGANTTKKRKKKATVVSATVKTKKPRKKKSDQQKTEKEVKTPLSMDPPDDEEYDDNHEEDVARKTKKIRLKLSITSSIKDEAAARVAADLDETSDEDVVEAQEVHHEDYQHDDSEGDGGANNHSTDSVDHSHSPAHHHSGDESSKMNTSREFIDGSQWGQQPNNYMVSTCSSSCKPSVIWCLFCLDLIFQIHLYHKQPRVGYSPTNYSYRQPEHQDRFPGFLSSEERRQPGLGDQMMYSTYSGPTGHPDITVSVQPPNHDASESEEELPF